MTKVKNPKTLRQSNRAEILYTLINKGALSRVQLAAELGLTTASITQLIHELMADGLVSEGETIQRNGVGRKEILIKYNDCNKGLGVNIEADKIHISVCTYNTVLAEEIYPTEDLIKDGDVSALSSKIADVSKRFGDVIGVGVGIAGLVDDENGVAQNSYGILPPDFPLKKVLQKELKINDVYVTNNVRAQARALVTHDNREFLLIKHSPGIGCALTVGGKVLRGVDNRAGEIGHTIVEIDGDECRCGKHGCLETVISDKNVSRKYYQLCNKNLSAREIYKLYARDAVAKQILDRCIDLLALAIGNACMLTDPKQVLVTGGIFFDDTMYELLLSRLSELGFGGAFQIKLIGNDERIKAFAGARMVLHKKLFEV